MKHALAAFTLAGVFGLASPAVYAQAVDESASADQQTSDQAAAAAALSSKTFHLLPNPPFSRVSRKTPIGGQ